MVKGIVEKLGGRIELISATTDKTRTCFGVVLPAPASAAGIHEESNQRKSDGSTFRFRSLEPTTDPRRQTCLHLTATPPVTHVTYKLGRSGARCAMWKIINSKPLPALLPLKCTLCGFTADNHPADVGLCVHHLDTVHPGHTWAIFAENSLINTDYFQAAARRL